MDEPRGRRLPLNSKKLTAAHLRQIAQSFGLPTGRSAEETRQLIEGKMTERGQDPLVQVYLAEEPQLKVIIWLVDSDGPFLQTPPTYREWKEGDRQSVMQARQELEAEVEELHSENSRLRSFNDELQGELGRATDASALTDLQAEANVLRENLEAEKAKRKQAWKLSCEQVADQDELLVAKEEEIARLREQLATAAMAPHTGAGGRLPDPAIREPPRSTLFPLPAVGTVRTVTPPFRVESPVETDVL